MALNWMRPQGLKAGFLAVLLLGSQGLLAGIWISPDSSSGKHSAKTASADKTLLLNRGAYPMGLGASFDQAEVSAFVVGPDGAVSEAKVAGGQIRFRAPLKGYHWVFAQVSHLKDETLEIELAKYRFYNRQGDVKQSVLKEIRGRTNDSKYGRDPIADLPFEIVLQKPEQAHHISCCLYSGDLLRAKVYMQQQPLKGATIETLSDSGWRAPFTTDASGLFSFPIPRYRYDDSGRRGKKERMLITADYQVDSNGVFQGSPYHQIHYQMSLPIDFRASPLEWAAKLPAFLLLGGVTLLTGFGVFLYRLKVRRRRLTCT